MRRIVLLFLVGFGAFSASAIRSEKDVQWWLEITLPQFRGHDLEIRDIGNLNDTKTLASCHADLKSKYTCEPVVNGIHAVVSGDVLYVFACSRFVTTGVLEAHGVSFNKSVTFNISGNTPAEPPDAVKDVCSQVGISPGVIAGIVIAVIGLLILLAVGGFWLHRLCVRRRANQDADASAAKRFLQTGTELGEMRRANGHAEAGNGHAP